MGLELIIMPLRSRKVLGDSIVICFEQLKFEKDYTIFAQIADINGNSVLPDLGNKPIVHVYPIPPKMFIEYFDGEKKRITRENPYGDELVYSSADDMKKLKLSKDSSSINKAIIAYVKELKGDTPIILQWRY